MPTRDEFPQSVKDALAKRVGYRCSSPSCRKLTTGPHEDPKKSVNIGVAAHITAAASGKGGKRYNPDLSPQERSAIENGIWLCQNCGKLIDSDEQKYPVALLLDWKRDAEQRASSEIENAIPQISQHRASSTFEKYLKNLVDTPQSWWLDAINESTWYEFELFTKIQGKPDEQIKDQSNDVFKPILKAIHDRDKRAILITGGPGSGKSTLLEKLAVEAACKAQKDCNAAIPVLVKLKDYESSGEQSGIRGLIQSVLENYVNPEEVNQLLRDRKILLLIDGWNELSDEKAKSKIKTFCQPHFVIVSSRNAGDYREIQEKFEIQPLSRQDVELFFDQRLPNTARQKLQELVDRVRDFGQTPLMVWMLFSIFCNDDPIPETRGEAYRSFSAIYAKHSKAGIDLGNARKLLGKLAFEMMRSPNSGDPTDFRLKVSEVEAEDILGSEEELNRMLNHLLKQQGKLGNREISFCHQSLQEYYAAEHLRQELKQNSDWLQKHDGEEQSWFQQHYSNYTKWTEPIAMMLGLPEINQDLALQIVEQALAVDLMLGARLAGEVRSDFQEKTIELVQNAELPTHLKPPEWMEIDLLGITKSDYAASLLKYIIFESNDYSGLDSSAAWELRHMSSHLVVPILEKAFQEKGKFVKYRVIDALIEIKFDSAVSLALSEDNAEIRYYAMHKIGEICTKDSVMCLVRLIALSKINLKTLKPKPVKYHEETGLKDLTVEDTEFETERNTISFGTRFIKNMPLDIVNLALLKCIDTSEDDSKIIALEFLGELNSNSIGDQFVTDSILDNLFRFESDVCIAAITCIGQIQKESSFIYKENVLEENTKEIQISHWKSYLSNSTSTLVVKSNAMVDIAHLENEISDWLVTIIMEMLHDPDIQTSSHIAMAITRLATNLPGQKDRLNITIPKILKLFQNSDTFNRGYFAQALGILGSLGNQEICQALTCMVKDNNLIECSYEIDAIGCLQCQEAIPIMLNKLDSFDGEDSYIQASILRIFPSIKGSEKILPNLWKIIDTSLGNSVFTSIQGIQSNCKFYNYEIYQKAIDRKLTAAARGNPQDRLANIEQGVNQINQRTEQMAEQPSTISISGGTFNGPVNLASNQGTQPTTIIDTQNNNYFGTDETFQQKIVDLQQLITELENQHPNLNTETQATEIVQQKLSQIQTQNPDRWQKLRDQMSILKQQFFNRERHAQALKATLVEVTKAKWEESLIVKAIVTYLDKFSETPDKGA